MAAIKLEAFQGLIPRVSDRLLPPMAATVAKNTKLLQGEIRGYNQLREEADFVGDGVSPVSRIFRVIDPDGTYSDTWLTFNSKNVDVIRSPVINDSFNRYYWAGSGRPKYNTAQRIFDGDAEYFLGVPTPVSAPGVTPPSGTDETRGYVYTFESAYGEEGPPSPATVDTGDAGTWELAGMDTTVPDASNRNITNKNIYRTVSGEDQTNFHFVAQIPLAQATYSDSILSTVVASADLLESTSWIEPVTTMEGWVAMPNGFLVGWKGRRLMFSYPYRPHAWPAEYELSTEFEIVALAVYGSTLIIGTKSQPYFGQGTSPLAFTTEKFDAVEPCLSRRGMVATVAGVYYPSLNGLVFATRGGVRIITQDLLTREEWATYSPENIFATQLGLEYLAFNSSTAAILFNPTEPHTKLIELEGFSTVDGIDTDPYSGEVHILSGDKAWEWDRPNGEGMAWRWVSKVYQTPKPLNFGAARLNFRVGTEDITDDIEAYYGVYNSTLFPLVMSGSAGDFNDARGLNTLNGNVLGGSPARPTGLVAGWTEPETRQPLGGSLLYPITFMSFQNLSVRLIVHVRDKVVFDSIIQTEDVIRLPTGFKSDIWQFEMIGNTDVYSLQVAETPKQLAIT